MEKSQIIGCILGTAIGDAIGLPYEGLSRRRGQKLFGTPDRHFFFWGWGMVSDDTEHLCLVAQSLIASGGDVGIFQEQLAKRLKLWLLGLPAGIGMATLRSIVKLWLGYNSQSSGVFSAGNGPAMRSAILGVMIDDPAHLRRLVKASTSLTHSDPKAEYGAFAVALAAQQAKDKNQIDAQKYLLELEFALQTEGEELLKLIQKVVASVQHHQSTSEFASSLGLIKGVSGYVYNTVPIAIHAWLTHPLDYREAIISVIECGGDTDTVAAIVGGIVGTSVGKEGIPSKWLTSLREWPRSVAWMEKLGTQLYHGFELNRRSQPLSVSFLAILFRNLIFLMIVLSHGFRRLLPPY